MKPNIFTILHDRVCNFMIKLHDAPCNSCGKCPIQALKKGKVYFLGDIVHNQQVIEDLESKGLKFISTFPADSR